MSNQSNGEKLKALYKKALSTSMLLYLSEEEIASLTDLPPQEKPTTSGQPTPTTRSREKPF